MNNLSFHRVTFPGFSLSSAIAHCAAIALLLGTTQALASAKCYPLVKKFANSLIPIEEVEIRVTGKNGTLGNALGWGAHFSTVTTEDGYGGGHSECHLNFTGAQNFAMCYDGVLPQPPGLPVGAQNNFRLDLGPAIDTTQKSMIRDVTFLVTRRAVKVRATRISRGPTTEVAPYVVESTFPMREYSQIPSLLPITGNTSGFWDNNKQICIELDAPVVSTAPPLSDVLALDNSFTTGSPYGVGLSPLTAFASEGVLNNNTACSTSVLATGNRCGSGFIVNMIMKQ
jgi:hypothetical protein